MKKRWLLILSILCIGLLFAACRKEKTPNEEPSATDETASPDAFPIAEATVIRPSKTPDIIIKVNPDRADLVETRIIDGRQCLVIPVDDHIEVNGINVRTMKWDGRKDETSAEEEE